MSKTWTDTSQIVTADLQRWEDGTDTAASALEAAQAAQEAAESAGKSVENVSLSATVQTAGDGNVLIVDSVTYTYGGQPSYASGTGAPSSGYENGTYYISVSNHAYATTEPPASVLIGSTKNPDGYTSVAEIQIVNGLWDISTYKKYALGLDMHNADGNAHQDIREAVTSAQSSARQAYNKAQEAALKTEVMSGHLAAKADNLSLSGNTLQLMAGETVIGNAVTLPGGGGDSEWRLLYEGGITEPVGALIINQDMDGQAFACKELYVSIRSCAMQAAGTCYIGVRLPSASNPQTLHLFTTATMAATATAGTIYGFAGHYRVLPNNVIEVDYAYEQGTNQLRSSQRRMSHNSGYPCASGYLDNFYIGSDNGVATAGAPASIHKIEIYGR